MRKLPYKRSQSKGAKYYLDFTEVLPDGSSRKVSRSSKTTDYKLACQILKKLQGEAAKRLHGVINPKEAQLIAGGAMTLSQTLVEFTENLQASRVTGPYRQQVLSVIQRFASSCGDKQVKHLTPRDCEKFAVELMGAGLGVSTIHQFLGYIKRYGRWLDSSGKVIDNPFRHVKRSMKGHDPKRRRALLHDEVTELCKYLKDAPDWYQHTCDERKAMYLLAIRTGLRVNEIAQLTTKSFVFGTTSFVSLPKSQTKNKKGAKLFMGDSVSQLIEQLVSDGRDTPFRITSYVQDCAAKMIRGDMEAARKASGRSLPFLDTSNVDFHALRHTCGAWLCWDGVPIQVVQKIMRHSKITMTIDVYGHLLPDEIESTVTRTDKSFAAHLLPL